MNHHLILESLNLFFAGILAGLEISAHYGFQAPTVSLEEKPQLQLRQGIIRRLRWLVPAFFVPTALSGIVVTILGGTSSGFLFRSLAILAIITWIAVRIVATVPTNSATMDWNPDAPPQDWRERIGSVERFHVVGTWAAILAFLFFLIAMTLRLSST